MTVKQATLHNEEDLRRKDMRDGDEVIVMRAGDVIPQVVSPTDPGADGKERRAVRAAGQVPRLRHADGQARGRGLDDAARTATTAPGRSSRRVKHFAREGAMDIEGLGEKHVRRFSTRG